MQPVCRLSSASFEFRGMLLCSPLECIAVVEVSVAVLLLLNIHQMGYFTLLGIFILELFLTREILKIKDKKKL